MVSTFTAVVKKFEGSHRTLFGRVSYKRKEKASDDHL